MIERSREQQTRPMAARLARALEQRSVKRNAARKKEILGQRSSLVRALAPCGARASEDRSTMRPGALERGVTLIEVMIVVAILALVAGGVAVFAMPKFQQAQDTTAKTAAQTIRQAVQSFKTTDTEGSCPTVAQLVQAKELDPGQQTVDPWGEDFIVNCTDDDVIVLSKGRDKKQGTKDDIQVPKGVAAAAAAE